MTTITIIGAGSVKFTLTLCSDILLTPALQDAAFRLMDIDPLRLEQARALVQTLIDRRKLKATVMATMDAREAVRGARYVITTIQQGGLDAYRLDIEIPRKYGVEQCVGDTLGPGGVFRALRTIPVLAELGQHMADDALLLNYVNPMAMNCWGWQRLTGRPFIGLCHSVQGTSEGLASWLGVPIGEVHYRCAGINHQSFFLEFKRGHEDLYPALWKLIERPEIYAKDPVRIDLMKMFGYFVTESSGHGSEYVPYFRKSAKMVEEELVPKFKDECNRWFYYGQTGGYYRECCEWLPRIQQENADMVAGKAPLPDKLSHEYAAFVINASETNAPVRVNGNVINRGLIDNLPSGCCVEVPCLIDANGVQPVAMGALPPQCAALNRTNINVQELAVEAAVTGRRDAVHQAVALDPLTAAVCTLPQIHAMVDEMIAAQRQWLPWKW